MKMKSECEKCSKPLPPNSGNAYICASERTYCGACAAESDFNCPRCDGELVRRPRIDPSYAKSKGAN